MRNPGNPFAGTQVYGMTRREIVAGALAAVVTGTVPSKASENRPFRFGLTPVFLSNDLELLNRLRGYLSDKMGMPVELVSRRTYQEVTALLVSSQIESAWICGFPYIQFKPSLELVATPVWKGKPLYQAYLIAKAGRKVDSWTGLQGDVHAFSDPDSNSGFLVTRALLAENRQSPSSFFSRSFFTYGHRNVIRAVASGLAQSGSVDGYVYEVMRETEPDLINQTQIVRASEWLGFPPIAAPKGLAQDARILALQNALIAMPNDPDGRKVLELLRLDGFQVTPPSLFDSIAAKVELVRQFG